MIQKPMRRLAALALSALLAVTLLSGCGEQNGSAAITPNGSQSASGSGNAAALAAVSLSADVSAGDSETSWDDSATRIELEGASALISGAGATADGRVVTIAAAGTYVVSGSLTDGQIVVAATSADRVHLVLNGVEIAYKSGAPIYASQCDKLIITLADGSYNALSDGASAFQYADEANEEPNAALFCKDDLTINGTGSLTVEAGFNNGIGTKDDLLIIGGNITVNAANHGLRGNDSVTVTGGSLQISAGSDGIQTNNETDAEQGWALIEGGTFAITCGNDAVQADTALLVAGGEFAVTAGGGAAAADGVQDSETDTSDSYKGLKAGGELCITGGTFVIDSRDDCLHANGDLTIEGGVFTLSSGDDGVHADADLTVRGGTIDILTSCEGLEGYNLAIEDGVIQVVSSDDGINAAGSGGEMSPGGGSSDCSMLISGGNVTVSAGDDGLDSNGSLLISGGTVTVLIESQSGSGGGTGALDSDGNLTITGGTVIYGGAYTGDSPGESSTQSYVYLESSIAAGTEVTLQKDGKAIASFMPELDCRALQFSTPEIISGESYDVYSGGALLQTVTAGTGGGQGGGGQKGHGGGELQGQPPADGSRPGQRTKIQ